ncbi:MAG: phospho-N-acetylmuramoyl-pentapeptide-transferase [Salinivirgaceae bacterium]|nr:phospho-N-acetylmuramoyl-pentapeptide-transferase [Salinivirgaceae bacterium]
MLYYFFKYLDTIDIPGAGMFQYISFRGVSAFILALLISAFFGKSIIRLLQRKQIGEEIRDLGLEGQVQKKGTPTMGGIIIILATLIPVLLFAQLNVYVILLTVTMLWLGALGFADDYIKVFKGDKEGMSGKSKIIGQAGLGLVVGLTLFMSDDVVIREVNRVPVETTVTDSVGNVISTETDYQYQIVDVKSTKTTIPFFKNNEGDYAGLVSFLNADLAKRWAWVIFILVAMFIIIAVSNAANLTDGLDGLATGTSAIIMAALGVLAYLGGHIIYSSYLNIMYIPHTSELVIFAAACIGALVGFLWYNSFPAQVFMGDTGSLSLGGVIAVMAIMIHKELLIPILCGIFFVEDLSVIIQTSYFKYTKKKYGEGRRVFLMAPLHHHYQKKGIHEAKIVTRFWVVCIILAAVAIATLKIR